MAAPSFASGLPAAPAAPPPAAAACEHGAATSSARSASGARRLTPRLLGVRRQDLAHVVAHAVVACQHRVAAAVAVVEHVRLVELLVLAQQLDPAALGAR